MKELIKKLLKENLRKLDKDIVCDKCKWGWDKKDTELDDMYICHRCGYDNESSEHSLNPTEVESILKQSGV